MAIEKSWKAIPAQSFTANGGIEGQISIASTKGFKVKQVVFVQATGQTDLQLRVQRVISKTQLEVGPLSGNIKSRQDLTLYTTAASATIHAKEQPRPDIGEKEYNRAVYEEEPTVAKRVLPVDDLGEAFGEDNPLPTVDTGDATQFAYDELDIELNAVEDISKITYKKEGVDQFERVLTYDANANLTNLKINKL